MSALAALALLVWAVLLFGRGRFWRDRPGLAPAPAQGTVDIVVPARDEEAVIGATLASLLAQDHASFRVILVDDASGDATGAIARGIADSRLTVLAGQPRPAGWSGKLWAVAQGLAVSTAPFVLLTDADIVHEPGHLSALLAKAQAEDLDLVSEMVALHCASLAERSLVPGFVYFFQLLYPFDWVNDPLRATAAAAGGSILIRRRALERIGGIGAIAGALIDDVALAQAVKRGGRIYLGHSALAHSVRPYPDFAEIWRMIARTAFVQLRHSWALLALTLLGLGLVFLVPPAAALFGEGWTRLFGLAAWVAMAGSYLPSLRRFRLSPLWAPLLPLIALFYMAATLGSALDHARGRGVVWKRRAYTEGAA